jgi:hypothetical protein
MNLRKKFIQNDGLKNLFGVKIIGSSSDNEALDKMELTDFLKN